MFVDINAQASDIDINTLSECIRRYILGRRREKRRIGKSGRNGSIYTRGDLPLVVDARRTRRCN